MSTVPSLSQAIGRIRAISHPSQLMPMSHGSNPTGRGSKKERLIGRLSETILDESERKLARHLAMLLGNRKYDARPLIVEILPRDWESNRRHTLKPRDVYRPFLYLRMRCNDWPPETRYLIHLTGLHLEGCLRWLAHNTPEFPAKSLSQPFGGLVNELRKQSMLPATLAEGLLRFNSTANVPAKHIIATAISPELDKRTFSVLDVSLAFVMMRKLSMQILEILRSRGVAVPQGWKTFNEDWLSRKPLVQGIPTGRKGEPVKSRIWKK